jgi:NADPH-dependent 2,4-dienoyl-CoA reductase/sulfur reductase-like enzyme
MQTIMASSARPVVEVADKAVVPGLRETLWNQQDQKVTYPKLEKEASADVIVVGAGISGLSIAYNLLKAGKSVIVLESRVVGAGQTGRSTAHIMPWFDDYYHLVEKLHGFDKAKQVADSYLTAIDWIEQTYIHTTIRMALTIDYRRFVCLPPTTFVFSFSLGLNLK